MHRIREISCHFYFSVWRNITLVRVATDDGLVGVGEATVRNKEMAVKDAVEHHIAPALIGESVFSVEKLFNTFFTRDPWRNGAVFNTAISGIETAMWDLIGQYCNQPVYNLLGGALRQRVPLYLNGWFEADFTIDQHADAASRVKQRGFRAMKWDPLNVAAGVHGESAQVDAALACVSAVREAVGPEVDLLIELHGKLSFDGAHRFVRGVVPSDPLFVEEPVHPDDHHAYHKLRTISPVPLAAGERYFTRWGYRGLLEEGYLSVLQPDMTHMGGILETKKVASMAEAYSLKVAPHNSSGPVATVATAQLDATLPNFVLQEMSDDVFGMAEAYVSSGFQIENGELVLGDKPGIGLTVDFERFERLGSYQRSLTF